MAVWLIAALLLVHLGYSGVSISYHAHGAELTDDYNERTKVTVGREVFGLLGMTVAVVLPTILVRSWARKQGYMALGLLFLPIVMLFGIPTFAWAGPSVHPPVIHRGNPFVAFFAPLKNRLFRRLLLVFVVNGAALGVAVTVMLFYVEHVLKGGKLQAGLILLTYFIAGAASVPLWLLLSKRMSKAAAWFVGMVMTAIAMSWRSSSAPGDFYWFLAISVVTGLGLGADYGLPPSILADVINSPGRRRQQGQDRHLFRPVGALHQARHGDRRGGLAAGGGHAGLQSGQGHYSTSALVIVYIVLPVMIKIIAALLIWFIRIEAERGSVQEMLGSG